MKAPATPQAATGAMNAPNSRTDTGVAACPGERLFRPRSARSIANGPMNSNASGRVTRLNPAQRDAATSRSVKYRYNVPVASATNKLVSIPPMANVTDIGAIAQTRAAATPALRWPRDAAIDMSNAQVAASAAVLIASARVGNGARVPPVTAPASASRRAKSGV